MFTIILKSYQSSDPLVSPGTKFLSYFVLGRLCEYFDHGPGPRSTSLERSALSRVCTRGQKCHSRSTCAHSRSLLPLVDIMICATIDRVEISGSQQLCGVNYVESAQSVSTCAALKFHICYLGVTALRILSTWTRIKLSPLARFYR